MQLYSNICTLIYVSTDLFIHYNNSEIYIYDEVVSYSLDDHGSLVEGSQWEGFTTLHPPWKKSLLISNYMLVSM